MLIIIRNRIRVIWGHGACIMTVSYTHLVGAESYGVDPQQDKRTVTKAELTLAASMNRFQVTGTKFIKVTGKDGKKAEAEQWCKTWLGKAENNGKTSADADVYKRQALP